MKIVKRKASSKKNLALTLMALPPVIMLILFSYIPIFGLILAFKDLRYDKGILGSDWVGFKNFEFFFKSTDAWRVIRNTLGLNFLFIVATLVVSLAIALTLNEVRSRRAVKTVQTIMFFPYFVSWVVVGYLMYGFLHHNYGIINNALTFIGKDSVAWYARPEFWPLILTIAYIWKNAGYNSVIYYAGLMGIDSSYYEAAELDGASRWQMIWSITLPMIRNLIIIMMILAIGRIMFADFGLFFQLTRDTGALYPTTDVMDTYVYRALRVTGNLGVSSAVSFFQAIVGFCLILVSNLIVRRIDSDSALF